MNISGFKEDILKAAESPTDNYYIANAQINSVSDVIQYTFVTPNGVFNKTAEVQPKFINDVLITRATGGTIFNPDYIMNANDAPVTLESVLIYPNNAKQIESIMATQFNTIGFRSQEPSVLARLFYAFVPTLIFIVLM
ncbi:UNVERIFIED_CONTAM: hypothetical protein O8I53_06460 [Campylobacter lari]